MRLIFLGPPGAGKGTLALFLVEHLKVAHLSSGNLLREAVSREDTDSKEAAQLMQAGALVPDDLVTGLVLKRLKEFGKDDSFVLDGFPRTVDQAKALDEAFARTGQSPIDLVIGFAVSAQTMVTRLAGRRVCSVCGANYHVERLPPKQEGVCDRCGGALKARSDDNPDTILNRLVVYATQTAPLLDFYRLQGKLREISGELGIEEQYAELLRVLREEKLLVA